MQKHTSSFLYALLIANAFSAKAQVKSDTTQNFYKQPKNRLTRKSSKEAGGYLNFSMGLGENFTHNPPINLALSFPYTNSLQPGTTQIFSAYKANLAANNLRNFNFAQGKIGFKYAFVDFGFGSLAASSNSTSNFIKQTYGNLGIGGMLPFGPKKYFTLQASVNYCGSDFTADLGNINNEGRTVYVMGLMAAPTYSYSVRHGTGRSATYSTAYANATNLNVTMNEEQNFVYPKLTLSSNPLTHTFYWAASLAYYFATKRKEYLHFTQTGSGTTGSNSVGDVDFVSSNITLLNDGKPVSKVPFNMSGFAFMLTIGVNIHIR